MMIAASLILAGCLSVGCADDAPVADPPRPPVFRVELSTPKADRLVGEPVPLVLTVRNQGPDAVHARVITWRDLDAYCVSVSKDRGPYLQILRGPNCCVTGIERIGPLETRTIRLRLFYTRRFGPNAFDVAAGRVFPGGVITGEPGEYAIKVAYPLSIPGAMAIEPIESNAVTIRVRQPERPDDIRAWQAISRDEAILRLLDDTKDHPIGDLKREDALTLADVLRAYPGTRYGDLIRRALRQAYPWRMLHADERAVVRRLARVTESIEEFYPNDDRLDATVALPAAGTPLRRALSDLEGRTGISLHASRTPAAVVLRSSGVRADLRGVMQRIADQTGAEWASNREGYALIGAADRRRDPDHPVVWDREEPR